MFRLTGSFWAEFSHDGRFLASILGRVVKIWDAQTGRELQTVLADMGSVRHVAFSPDGRHLAAGGSTDGSDGGSGPQGAVQVREVAGGRQVGESQKYPHQVYTVVYAGDGGSLLLGQGNSVLLA